MGKGTRREGSPSGGRIIENPVTGERLKSLAAAENTGGELPKPLPAAAHPRETLEALPCAKELGFCISTVTDHAPESVVRGSDVVLLAKVGAKFVSTRRR